VPPLGRDEEIATLSTAATAVAAGRGGIVWIEGEPGIGKSTLVNAALAAAADVRCRSYRAVGDELGQRLPLRALLDALGPAATSQVRALLQGNATAAG